MANQDESPPTIPQLQVRESYLQALLGGDRKEALQIVELAVSEGFEPIDVYLEVLEPAMHEVGALWENSTISVAQEHLATAITQYVMAHCYRRFSQAGAPPRKGPLILTGVAGELHEIGPRMVGDFLELQGWKVSFLGSNNPTTEVLRLLRERSPLALGVSVTMAWNLEEAAGLIQDIRGEFRFPVFVGGGAFRTDTGAWSAVGADAWGRDAADALRAVESVLEKNE